MNIEHLNKDEIEIECLVRGLATDDIGQLEEQIKMEETSSVLVSKRPHLSASKNPKRELQLCGVKLNNVKEWMKDNIECENMDEHLRLRSKLLHIKNRLNRMTYSKSIKNEIPQFIIKSNELLQIVYKSLEEKVALNSSLDYLNDFNLDIPSEDDFEEEFEIRDFHSTEMPKSKTVQLPTNPDINSTPTITNPIASTSKLPNQFSLPLKEMLEKEEVGTLIELLNNVIVSKSQSLTPEEIEHLSSLPTPPSRPHPSNTTYAQSRRFDCKRTSNTIDPSKSQTNFAPGIS